jgi:long-chain acyl-CoA synthetase
LSEQKEIIQVFSGGSCGEPKRLSRPRVSWLNSLAIETQIFGLKPDYRYAVLGSAQHSLWAYAMFRAQQTQAFCKGLPLSPRHQLATICANNISVLYAVTPLLHTLCRYADSRDAEVPCVEKIIVGGATWPESLTLLCQKTFPEAEIICFYGAAELGYVAHSKPAEPLQSFPQVQIRTDSQDQLWVRSPLTICPDDWLASGDRIAWADTHLGKQDQARFLILGRVDRVINQSGVKIQPEPIEEALGLTLDSSQLALLGRPDPLRGERVTLVLGPELQSRHIEVKEALQNLSCSAAPSLRAARLLQINAWPTRSNGKLNLKGLLEEIPKGRPIPQGAFEA